MATAANVGRSGLEISVGDCQSTLTVNIDLVLNEDLFIIVKLQDISLWHGRLERYRDLCRRLVPDPPFPDSYVEWHHLVDLFCILQGLSAGGLAKDSLIFTTGNNPPEVSAWFKEGVLPHQTKAYLFHEQPWQALITFNSMSDYLDFVNISPGSFQITELSKETRSVEVVDCSQLNSEDIPDLNLLLTSTPKGPDATTQGFSRIEDVMRQLQKAARYEKNYAPCFSRTKKPGESSIRWLDGLNYKIQPARNFCRSPTRNSTSFEPIYSSNTSPALSDESFNTKLTSSFTSTCSPSSDLGVFPQNFDGCRPVIPHHVKKKSTKNYSNELVLDSLASHREPKEFFTCRSLLGVERQLTAQQALLATASGLDLGKYKGDITTARIRDQLLPETENCSLRIIDIHPDITDKQLFQTIDTGKVYFYQRLPSKIGVHSTCAANLAFFDRYSAEKFYQKCSGQSGIWLGGYRIKALWNRDKSSPPMNIHISRVVTVYGLANLMNGKVQFLSKNGLEAFFRGKFHFFLVDTVEWMINSTIKAVRLEFGSARCQGQFARMSLTRFIRQNNLHDVLGVEYSADPCEKRL